MSNRIDTALEYIEQTCRTMKSDAQICALGKDCYANGMLAMVSGIKTEIFNLRAKLNLLEAQEDREKILEKQVEAFNLEYDILRKERDGYLAEIVVLKKERQSREDYLAGIVT